MHGTDHADVVDALSHMREKFAYFDAALAVLLESKRRLHQPAHLAERFTARNRSRRRNMNHKSSRNLSGCWPSGNRTLVHKLEFIGAEQNSCVFPPSGHGFSVHGVPRPFRGGLQELKSHFKFLGGGGPSVKQAIGFHNPGSIVWLGVYALRQLAGLRVDEVVVHEVQPLQRNVRGEALLGGKAGVREVKYLQKVI